MLFFKRKDLFSFEISHKEKEKDTKSSILWVLSSGPPCGMQSVVLSPKPSAASVHIFKIRLAKLHICLLYGGEDSADCENNSYSGLEIPYKNTLNIKHHFFLSPTPKLLKVF